MLELVLGHLGHCWWVDWKMATLGHFGATLGPFWAKSGHFGAFLGIFSAVFGTW